MTKNEIIDYALRYISPDEITDFPEPQDLFVMLMRKCPDAENLKNPPEWQFSGYNICQNYSLDLEAKPTGKWIWFSFISLAAFPPQKSVLKLQPPHIAKGYYQSPDRIYEFKIVKISLESEQNSGDEKSTKQSEENEKSNKPIPQDNIIQFPQRT